MLDFFVNNWGTLLAGVIVLAVVILVIVKLIRDKKKGKKPVDAIADIVLLRQDATMTRHNIRSPIENKNGVRTRNFTPLIV